MKTVRIISACVVTGAGADKVYLELDLPNATPYYAAQEPYASATITAECGTGAKWVREHCGIEPRVVNSSGLAAKTPYLKR